MRNANQVQQPECRLCVRHRRGREGEFDVGRCICGSPTPPHRNAANEMGLVAGGLLTRRERTGRRKQREGEREYFCNKKVDSKVDNGQPSLSLFVTTALSSTRDRLTDCVRLGGIISCAILGIGMRDHGRTREWLNILRKSGSF